MIRSALALSLLLLLATGSLLGQSPAPKFAITDGETLWDVTLSQLDARAWINMQDILPGAKSVFQPYLNRLMIFRDTLTLTCVIESPYVLANKVMVRLGLPIRIDRGSFWIESESFQRALGPALGLKLIGVETEHLAHPILISSDTTAKEEKNAKGKKKEKDLRDLPKMNRIVLDPGHGGRDPGAVGGKSAKEKDVTLRIAKKVAERLRLQGWEVTLTRDKDVFVPLRKRTKLANDADADLFVSIHCNANTDKRAKGSWVYFLSPAKTSEARAAANLENSAIQFESDDDRKAMSDLDFILLDIQQNEFLKESDYLAQALSMNIGKIDGFKAKGVDQAGFYVLNGAFMPAVLVETGFISNPDESKLLRDDATQNKIAAALVKGIAAFAEAYRAAPKRK